MAQTKAAMFTLEKIIEKTPVIIVVFFVSVGFRLFYIQNSGPSGTSQQSSLV